MTFQNNESQSLQIDAGQTADKSVYLRPLSVRVGSGGFALFSSAYFTNVVSPAFGYYDVAEIIELSVKFRPTIKRATNLYLPV